MKELEKAVSNFIDTINSAGLGISATPVKQKIMTLIEIKKELYKKNPPAIFVKIAQKLVYYYADLPDYRVYFEIPISDVDGAEFTSTMESKFLQRWIVI